MVLLCDLLFSPSNMCWKSSHIVIYSFILFLFFSIGKKTCFKIFSYSVYVTEILGERRKGGWKWMVRERGHGLLVSLEWNEESIAGSREGQLIKYFLARYTKVSIPVAENRTRREHLKFQWLPKVYTVGMG